MKKFIVYLTINTVNRKIYVGVHSTKDPSKFDGYIGNGVYKGSKFKVSTPFRRAVIKYGEDKFERVTLGIFDTKEEAYYQEAQIVTEEFIKRKDTYNVAIGGDNRGAHTTKIIQYTLSGKFIKVWNRLQDVVDHFNKKSHQALVKALTGKRASYLKYQWKYWEEDFPEVIPPIEGRIPDKVIKYSLDGDLIEEFDSAYAAAKSVTDSKDRTNQLISNRARIIKKCTQTLKPYAGYQWRKFVEEIPITIETINTIDHDIVQPQAREYVG